MRGSNLKKAAATMLVLSATGWAWTAAAAPAPPAEFAASLSSTTFHDGDVITLSGSGCIDPKTGTGDGLDVVASRLIDMGRSQGYLETIRVHVEADGTFSGTGTIAQPLLPVGTHAVDISCERPVTTGPGTRIASDGADVTFVAPALPDLTVQAGASFDFVMPCTIRGGTYGGFGVGFTVPGRPTPTGFGLRGKYPYDQSAQKGDHVTLTVPADIPPGTYDATASCAISEGGTQAYFTGFTVTVTAAAATAPKAPAANPITGAATFTG